MRPLVSLQQPSQQQGEGGNKSLTDLAQVARHHASFRTEETAGSSSIELFSSLNGQGVASGSDIGFCGLATTIEEDSKIMLQLLKVGD